MSLPSWLGNHAPEVLLRPGPFDVLWGQWLAVLLLVPCAWAGGKLLGWVTRGVLRRVAARTTTTWDDALVELSAGPISLAWALLLARLALPLLKLDAEEQGFASAAIKALLLSGVALGLWRSIDVLARALASHEWALAHPSSRALVPLARRIAKVALVALAVVSVLSVLGFPVGSLLAGLGIGGLALALAAQKTVENLIGAFALGVDQPIREGDWVKVDDVQGTVEAIGLRSTRIRTNDRTVVSLPNGRLADLRLENFTQRDRLLLSTVLGLRYGTRAAQVRAICARVEALLRAHALTNQDTVVVGLRALGASSMDVEVLAWLKTADQAAFRAARQELLLGMLEIVEQEGSALAFPTQTLHLERQGP